MLNAKGRISVPALTNASFQEKLLNNSRRYDTIRLRGFLAYGELHSPQLIPAAEGNMNRLHDFRAVDREFAYDGSLGAIYSSECTEFRVWSPTAERVILRLYRGASDQFPFSQIEMQAKGGVWSAAVPGDLHGIFYTYEITIGGINRETIDIYARAAGANGIRGMVTDLSRTNPDGWEDTQPVRLQSYTDAVIYELHVRDFSSDESGSFTMRGKFGAFCERNVVNSFGDIIGLDYIAQLGVTHIHLLPVFDFQSVDETAESPGFNWGYDPLNFNLPEGSYSTNPNDGSIRIRQFKELIQAAHSRGLGIIMDVVYNHTYSTDNSPFTMTFPDYYYRRSADGRLSNGSGCGNEFASERAMARKFICDSLCYWAEEYKLDGFRFDLMGMLDIRTLNLCAKKLKKINPSIILYGEGWTGGSSLLSESRRAVKHNAVKLPDFAMFSDDFRDGVKGSVFNDSDCGYVNGNNGKDRAELIKSVMSGGIYHSDVERESRDCWTDSPQQSVNYVEAHDNLTLFDKLKCSMPGASDKEIEAADKLAAALVFLSQGIPFIQAGQEILRSKPDPEGGYVHDSYKSPDSVNSIKWNNVTIYRNVMEYYRGLIAIRKRFPQLRMKTADEIRQRIRYEDMGGGAVLMHIDRLLLMVNPTGSVMEYITDGEAAVYADSESAAPQPLYYLTDKIYVNPHSITLAELLN